MESIKKWSVFFSNQAAIFTAVRHQSKKQWIIWINNPLFICLINF